MGRRKKEEPFEAKDVAYRTLISAKTQKRLVDGIVRRLVVERQYVNPDYSARQLAADLNTNARYLSGVFNLCFGTNFPRMVAKYRVNEACYLLSNPINASLSIEQIGLMVGFKNRQNFYTAFGREMGTTPAKYRAEHQGKGV